MNQAVRTATRPRIEGEREVAIFDATMRMLATSGYDRLTMDAVAADAKASKATLYRRWQTKADLVVDALVWLKSCMPHDIPDTGSLRGDLVAMACTDGGLTDRMPLAVFGALITAMQRDEALAKAFQERFMGPIEAAQPRWSSSGPRPGARSPTAPTSRCSGTSCRPWPSTTR